MEAVVLGLFHANQPQNEDMIVLDRCSQVKRIDIKPAATDMKYAWMIAVWTSEFTEFIHDYVAAFACTVRKKSKSEANAQVPELFPRDVIQAAIEDGLAVTSVIFSEGNYLDIGTPENLKKSASNQVDQPIRITRPVFVR